MEIVFWISAFLIFYTYLGYGLLLFFVNSLLKRNSPVDVDLLPPVTFIVPAYNEEGIIEAKIKNTLALIYPADKINFVFVTDGCTDNTAEIIKGYPQILLLNELERTGKSNAINRAMALVHTPIVVFSDANILLDKLSVRHLVRHYNNPQVGGVSGEKRISAALKSNVGFGERIYWQYESFLKKAAADFYTLVGAAGELFSIRTSLYQPLADTIILDDFVISANICKQGYRFLYEKKAYGIETPSSSIKEEGKRKIRISAGCFQALVLFKSLLNPFNSPRMFFQYFSHRILRWTVCPVLIPLVFILNFFLKEAGAIYQFLFWLQCSFYLLVVIGWVISSRKLLSPFLLIPYYFVFMILSQYAGFYRFLQKKQSVLWEKASRAQ